MSNNPAKKKKMNKDINLSILQELSAKVLLDSKQKDRVIKDEEEDNKPVTIVTDSKKSNEVKSKTKSSTAPGWDSDYNPWAGVVEVKEEKMSDEEDEEGTSETNSTLKSKKHLSKKEKKELDRLEASEIARLEKQVLDGEKAEPVTAAEFDR